MIETGLIETGAGYILDTGNPSVVASGSGCHFDKAVTFSFDYLVRDGEMITRAGSIAPNFFIGEQQIDILTIKGDTVVTGFYSGLAQRSITITEQDNIDAFGSYSGNFAIRSYIDDPTTSNATHQAIYRTFANVPIIDNITVQDGSGVFYYPVSKPTFSGDNYSTASMDERTGNRDIIAEGIPRTGSILVSINCQNDPLYTRYRSFEVYAETGITGSDPVSIPLASPENFVQNSPVVYQSKRHIIEIFPDSLTAFTGVGTGNNADAKRNINYNFNIVGYSEIGSGVGFGVGPHSFKLPERPKAEVETERIRISPNSTSTVTADEASIYYITGRVETTSSTKIDTIPIGVHHNIHYMCKVQDSLCNIYTTNLMVTLTHCTSNDYEIQEYGQSADNYSTRPEFCLTSDSDNVYLEASMASNAPFDYGLYRTSI